AIPPLLERVVTSLELRYLPVRVDVDDDHACSLRSVRSAASLTRVQVYTWRAGTEAWAASPCWLESTTRAARRRVVTRAATSWQCAIDGSSIDPLPPGRRTSTYRVP